MRLAGWARIDREVTVVDGLIDLLAGWVYRADSVRVRGAEPAAEKTAEAAPETTAQ